MPADEGCAACLYVPAAEFFNPERIPNFVDVRHGVGGDPDALEGRRAKLAMIGILPPPVRKLEPKKGHIREETVRVLANALRRARAGELVGYILIEQAPGFEIVRSFDVPNATLGRAAMLLGIEAMRLEIVGRHVDECVEGEVPPAEPEEP